MSRQLACQREETRQQFDLPLAIALSNDRFAGADFGRERPAAMFAVIGMGCMNGFPEAYQPHVINHIADRPIDRVDELLASNVALRRKTTSFSCLGECLVSTP